MLGIGMQEMLIIGIVALLIFGPGKLPEVMGQAGKLYRDFRKMTGELTGEFEKTVAEARELGNSLTGDMQKEVNSVTASVKRDLGKGSKVTNTSNLKKGGATSTAKSGSSSKTSTASKTGSSSARSTTSSSTSSSRNGGTSTASKTSTASTAAKKPAVPVASKEDPVADISVFEPVAPQREHRARRATPSVITDPTPRDIFVDVPQEKVADLVAAIDTEDPLARARQRRRNAGYAQRSA